MRAPKTTYRLSFMLAGLSLLPLYFFGFDKAEGVRLQQSMDNRSHLCEELAVASSLHLRRNDNWALKQQLNYFRDHTPLAESARIVRFDGNAVATVGDHDSAWHLLPGQSSDLSNIRIAIQRDGRVWGNLEVAFADKATPWSAFRQGMLTLLAILGINLVLFTLILHKTMSAFDGGNSVPRRVRNTLDTIAGGVVVLDSHRRIVLANAAFAEYFTSRPNDLVGKSLDGFAWINTDARVLPWHRAIDAREQCSGATLSLIAEGNNRKWFVVNATPVFDSKDRLAGALISFEDVTILEEQKLTLVEAMRELESSREQIRLQNEKLRELASRDALTGIMNRRELFERLDQHWLQYTEQGMAFGCMMLDVDHFKRLNDTHGHAVGDLVLKSVARTLEKTVGTRGVVARYGGEEFCVVTQSSPALTAEVGEAIRHQIAQDLKVPYAVTVSVGVSHSLHGADAFQDVLEHADKALYAAKHGGRNRVCVWSAELQEAEAKDSKQVKAKRAPVVQSIPYHAVASLHSALTYRDADTARHCQRVAEMSVALGRGLMSITELYVLEIAGLLHDIGKIGVPDSVLLKPGKLTPEEWKIMEAHTRMGMEIVHSSFDCEPLTQIVRWHHCHFGGLPGHENMPVGLDIPLGARIVSIVDAFDAMVSDRVYRPGRPPEEAFAELRRCAGKQFDPELVERFVNLQIGWRLDSRFGSNDLDNKVAISIGQQTERIIQSFEVRDRALLCEQLQEIGNTAKEYDMPGIAGLAVQLCPILTNLRDDREWEQLIPIMQDLIEMCLTIQRAHIRQIGVPQLLLLPNAGMQ